MFILHITKCIQNLQNFCVWFVDVGCLTFSLIFFVFNALEHQSKIENASGERSTQKDRTIKEVYVKLNGSSYPAFWSSIFRWLFFVLHLDHPL